ncbi:MAG: prolipoprotein diacylglyceryl transferase [Phycisphaerales bacterium]|nr:prolipoprotein diacylglyceryl transferase [Phycisphaerales bacterium]
MTLAAWLHTLSPYLVRISDSGFGLRWYGLSYLAGFLVAYLLLRACTRRGLMLIPPERIGDAMMWFIGGVLVGGRLGYVLLYQPDLLGQFSRNVPWWGVLAIQGGGMSAHGGIAGVIFAAWRVSRGWRTRSATGGFTRTGRVSTLHLMDLIALLAPLGLMFGRLANFINGELLGRVHSPPGTSGPWWTVQFPQELRGWLRPGVRTDQTPALTPGQEQELWSLAARASQPGDTSYTHALDRVIANAATYASELRPLLSSRYPSQLFQAAAELALFMVLWVVWARPRKPGVVGCWFMMTYGLLRIVTEFWRLPDAQFAVERPLGLSRGQWYSVPMVVFGAAMLVWVSRRRVPKMGGWMGRPFPASTAMPAALPEAGTEST